MRENVFISAFGLGLFSYYYFNGLANPKAIKTLITDDFGNLVDHEPLSVLVYLS